MAPVADGDAADPVKDTGGVTKVHQKRGCEL